MSSEEGAVGSSFGPRHAGRKAGGGAGFGPEDHGGIPHREEGWGGEFVPFVSIGVEELGDDAVASDEVSGDDNAGQVAGVIEVGGKLGNGSREDVVVVGVEISEIDDKARRVPDMIARPAFPRSWGRCIFDMEPAPEDADVARLWILTTDHGLVGVEIDDLRDDAVIGRRPGNRRSRNVADVGGDVVVGILKDTDATDIAPGANVFLDPGIWKWGPDSEPAIPVAVVDFAPEVIVLERVLHRLVIIVAPDAPVGPVVIVAAEDDDLIASLKTADGEVAAILERKRSDTRRRMEDVGIRVIPPEDVGMDDVVREVEEVRC